MVAFITSLGTAFFWAGLLPLVALWVLQLSAWIGPIPGLLLGLLVSPVAAVAYPIIAWVTYGTFPTYELLLLALSYLGYSTRSWATAVRLVRHEARLASLYNEVLGMPTAARQVVKRRFAWMFLALLLFTALLVASLASDSFLDSYERYKDFLPR